MNIHTIVGTDLNEATNHLIQGNPVAIPTETVYGLGANALDAKVVVKIFEAKNRPYFDPLIVHIGHLDQLYEYTQHPHPDLLTLCNQFWPGPLTVLVKKKKNIPDIVTSGSEYVALRVPKHPLTRKLLQNLSFPLAAPSANPFGYVSPTTAWHVYEQMQGKIPYILDGGPCKVGIESTIMGWENGSPIIYRAGGVEIEEIESLIGKCEVRISQSNTSTPGSLESHYAPLKPMLVGNIQQLDFLHKNLRIGYLFFKKPLTFNPQNQYFLSEDGDTRAAASRLFEGMRTLDKMNVDIILAEWAPEVGLGRAINDRLRRASTKRKIVS